jgi:hypothetical protein
MAEGGIIVNKGETSKVRSKRISHPTASRLNKGEIEVIKYGRGMG